MPKSFEQYSMDMGLPIRQQWTTPEIFDMKIAEGVRTAERLMENGNIRTVLDPIDHIARSIWEMENPGRKNDESAASDFIEDVKSMGDEFGNWVHYPWSGALVRFAPKDVHRALQTFRFKHLVSEDLQVALYDKRILFAGLSVGSRAVEAFLDNGIGGSYILADTDTIDSSNTGRISASQLNIGEYKLDWIAKKVSEKDPWIEQTHLRNGITHDTVGNISVQDVDIIVEEVDSLQAKAQLRLWARENSVPLVMAADIHNKSVVDVERYDLGDRKASPFLGRIPTSDVEQMSSRKLSEEENIKYMLKHTGFRDLSAKMIRSFVEIGETTGGIPQLGTTTIEGGANLAFVARSIFAGEYIASGRYRTNPRNTFGLGNESGARETVRSVRDLAKKLKK